MNKLLALTLLSAAAVSSDQAYPGQPTQAKVWIQNLQISEPRGVAYVLKRPR